MGDILLGIIFIHCIHYVIKLSSNAMLPKCKFSERELEQILDHPCLHEKSKEKGEEEEEEGEEEDKILVN